MSGGKETKRLGRGLAALLGDAAVPASPNAAGVQSIPVEFLEPSPFQPRREMDETALTELADSIAARGILQPLLVRPKPGVEGQYQIIAGERRWRAAQKASLHEVPVLVRDLSDADAMAAGLVENLQREDLNAIDEAEGYKRLLEEFALSQERLGEAIGKSREHISNALRILRLPAEVQGFVRAGILSPGHAKALLAHAEPVRGAKEVIKRQLSVRQTEALARDYGHNIKQSEITGIPRQHREGAEVEALGESLSVRLGLKVAIRYNGKGGAVTLNYGNLDQLDAILALLNG